MFWSHFFIKDRQLLATSNFSYTIKLHNAPNGVCGSLRCDLRKSLFRVNICATPLPNAKRGVEYPWSPLAWFCKCYCSEKLPCSMRVVKETPKQGLCIIHSSVNDHMHLSGLRHCTCHKTGNVIKHATYKHRHTCATFEKYTIFMLEPKGLKCWFSCVVTNDID